MAFLAARGESLCESAIRKLLEGAVNPSEAKCLFHDINIWKYARRGSLAPTYDDPALLFLGVILLQPGPKLRPL
ncbi:MAG: hypothetical protein J6Q12_04600 [Bacteroidales bacterium]|nr:hypothetical protein [Bacteroidales bacterium]